MKTSHAISIAVLSFAMLWSASAAMAQLPPDAVMLVPGVYTTPEISAKCQKYARDRVGLSGHTDTARQSVALACAQKLWQKQVKGTR
jgi:hypothetical protein